MDALNDMAATLTSKIKEDQSQRIEQDLENHRKITKLEKELADMKENYELSTSTLNIMVMREREASQELVGARVTAGRILKFLDKKNIRGGTQTPAIDLGRVGEIDGTPWRPEMRTSDFYSFGKLWWKNHISSAEFQPFKTVKTGLGGDDWKMNKRVIDHENDDLCVLKYESGDEVYDSVITALNELEEFNPSERQPFELAWVFEKRRAATMNEILCKLEEVIMRLVTQREEVIDKLEEATSIMNFGTNSERTEVAMKKCKKARR